MSSDVEHILLTRFNLPSPGAERLIRAREGWLRDRVALFERYCLPSVVAQTEKRFRWIVYIDPASPDWFMDWVTSVSADGAFHPVARTEVPRPDLLADICRIAGGPPGTLITTNLDNDDGLSTDFVERVQSVPTHPVRTAIYITQGLIKSPEGLYLRTDRHNAFCSVQEPWEGAVTCWSEWHNRLHLRMAASEVAGPPGWLQVVHGSNVSNRVRGRLVSPQSYRTAFPRLLEGIEEPPRSRLVADRILHSPLRAVRDSSRAAARSAAIGLVGRDGLDRLRASLAAARSRT